MLKKVNYDSLPSHMRDMVKLYIEDGIPPGDFLKAVLSNQLKESFNYADYINIACMRDYVMFLYTDAPASCQGNESKVMQWMEHGGLNGLEKENE